MDIMAMALFPAVTANILFHHLCKNYGVRPCVVFRLILVLYVYFIPVVPRVPSVIQAFAKLLVPLVVYLFIYGLYAKKRRYAAKGRCKWGYAVTAFAVLVMTGVVALISCKFSYGMIVVATPSMTGTINVGDAIVYESYDEHVLAVGDIIVFDNDGVNIVHRIDGIESINGGVRYYTKGDDNDERDLGFITKTDIVGIVKVKVPYLGKPTLWVRSFFD
jgi:signal peptidase